MKGGYDLINITGVQFCDNEIYKLDVEDMVILKKEYNNAYDKEAIVVENIKGIKVGYVSNSVNTVIDGCKSAGRIYDKFIDSTFAQVEIIVHGQFICRLLSEEEKKKVIDNIERRSLESIARLKELI